MPQVRKLVRDGIYALVSNPTSGFNERYAEAKQFYPAAEDVVIDWSPGIPGQAVQTIAKNFFIGELDENELEQSGLQKFPAVCLFTEEADDTASDRRQKFMKFSGLVTAGLNWYVKHRDGIEQDNVEDTVSCIEDALLEVINGDSSIWPSGVVYNGDYKSGKPHVRLIGNGYVTVLPCQLTFEVHV